MGLGRQNGLVNPTVANYPTGTPAELSALGFDLAQVHSCAVPTEGVRGCMYAKKCSKLFGRKGLRFGGFGPSSMKPGTAGEGPEYVPYSIDFAEGEGKEDQTWCHMFMATLYNRMLASRDPDEPSGEKIRLLGKAGETRIVVENCLPAEPKTCNKTRNYTMVDSTDVVLVEKAPRITKANPRLLAKRAQENLEDEEFLSEFAGESAADSIDPAGASAEEAPARPRRKKMVDGTADE